MAQGLTNGVRVALLAVGLGAAAGGYAIWRANQPAAFDGTGTGDVAEEASVDAAPTATEAALPEPAAQESAGAEPAAIEPAAIEAGEPEPVETATATPDVLPDEPAAPILPTFDVVRIEPDGAALIAGTAPADARVSLRLDGVEELRVQAGGDGAFVAQFTLPPNPAPRLLSMVAVLADGTELAASDTVAIAPIAATVVAAADPEPAPAPPQAILLTDEGAEVIQGPTAVAVEEKTEVALETIAYAPDGAVQLSGRGAKEQGLRLYLDNAALMDAAVGADGKWAVTLPDVAPGIYTLRIDQIVADGSVSSRFETPFKREMPEALAAVGGVTQPELAPEPAPEPIATAALEPDTAAVPAAAPEVAVTPEATPDVAPADDVVAAAQPEPAPAIVPEPAAEPSVDPVPEPASEPVAEPATAMAVLADAPPTAPVAEAVTAEPVTAEQPVKAPITVTVQPGFTLWQIATEQFGEGTMYVQVFEANRDAIRDPDLIYPGQVFTLPQE